jgi:hypothetical protein
MANYKGPNKYREVTIDGAEAVEIIIESPKYGTHIALVDKEDYPRVKEFRWSLLIPGHFIYARTKIPRPDGTWYDTTSGKRERRMSTVQLHRLITNAPKGMVTDHINHNGLDNRKSNLRVCTNAENMRNQQSHKGSTSIYKGVCWDKAAGKWRAQIMFERKDIYIGCFTDEKEAARASDAKAKELHGEYAYLNFPDE